LESDNVLESFDFDSFLHNTDDNGTFGDAFEIGFGNADGVEAGAGDV
jgi:hypothetical protein